MAQNHPLHKYSIFCKFLVYFFNCLLCSTLLSRPSQRFKLNVLNISLKIGRTLDQLLEFSLNSAHVFLSDASQKGKKT